MKYYVIFYDDEGRLTVVNKSWHDWHDANDYAKTVASSRRPFVVVDAA